jgi:2-amino-4-hydroxy-6-hydroxymethyldihydropteridine diphosphokinase
MIDIKLSHIVFLSLGSNLGDRLGYLNTALSQLTNDHCSMSQVSGVYETKHWSINNDEERYPDFFNIACEIRTCLSPIDLLKEIKSIEKNIGRNFNRIRNSPREIDIDILLYDNLILNQVKLEIPHPRLALRSFVLAPLRDIAPNLIHPIKRESIKSIFASLEKNQKKDVKKIKNDKWHVIQTKN